MTVQSSTTSRKSSSSSVSQTVASVKTAVKKGAKVLARPFKKAKTAISTCAKSSSKPPTIIDLNDSDDSASSHNSDRTKDGGSLDVEIIEADPEKELGKHWFCCIPYSLVLTVTCRRPEEDMALTGLLFLHIQCISSASRQLPLPFLYLCSAKVQKQGRRHSPLSGLPGQDLNHQPSTSCDQVLWRRGGE